MDKKFEIIKDILMDMRESYQNQVNDLIDSSLGNGDITEEDAASLKEIF